MKKLFKIGLCLLITVILISSIFSMNTLAATATTHFSPNKTNFTIGEQLTVTITFNAGTSVYSIDGALSYNSAVMQYVSGGSSNKGNSVKIADALSGETQVSYSVTFKAIAEGQCSFSFSGFCTDASLNPLSATTGYFANVKAASVPSSSSTSSTSSTPSTNANLASLKVSGATLSPKFNSGKTEYTASVPYATDKVTITAGVADAGATVVGAGTINLGVGDNKRTLTVTAASGAKKSYNVIITRLAENAAPTEPDAETTDPLLISSEGVTRKIMQDISSMPVPESFTQSTSKVGGVQVGTLTEAGGQYTLYYTTLEDGSDAALFYKDIDGEYKRLLYMEVNSKFFIVANPPAGAAPKGWYEDVMALTAGNAQVYRSKNTTLSDFYVLYCYADGELGFYRFDSSRTTIQRAPDFSLKALSSNDLVPLEGKNIFQKFSNMNNTGKAIIILIIVAILCVTALAVILIMKLTGFGKKFENSIFSPEGGQENTDNEMLDDETDTENTGLSPETNEYDFGDGEIISDTQQTEKNRR